MNDVPTAALASEFSHIDDRRICGVVVTFHPSLPQLERLLLALLPQVSEVVVVDNTGTQAVGNALARHPHLHAVHLIEPGWNLGVAAGHNQGIAWASHRDHTDVLLMDQDSIPAPSMVQELIDARCHLQRDGCLVAAVGPLCVDARDGHAVHFHRYTRMGRQNVGSNDADARGLIQTDMLVSSGSLISLELLRRIGGMDEGLFVDQVDTEWFLRAKAYGYAAYGVCRTSLDHSLGDSSLRFWLGRWRYAPGHSPVRHYYTVRNVILLVTRDYIPAAWKLYALRQILATFVFYSLIGRPRHRHFLGMVRGLVDGLRGRSGPVT